MLKLEYATALFADNKTPFVAVSPLFSLTCKVRLRKNEHHQMIILTFDK